MTQLYENIKMLCKERKLPVTKLEIALDFPKNTISDWRKKLPSGERLLKTAAYFDVSIDFLLGNTSNRFSHKKSYSKSATRLLEASEFLELEENETDFIIKIMYLVKNKN